MQPMIAHYSPVQPSIAQCNPVEPRYIQGQPSTALHPRLCCHTRNPIILIRNRIVYFILHILFFVKNHDFLLFCEADKPQSSWSANPPLKRLPPLRQCRLNSWKTTSRSHCLALDHPFKLSREEFLKMEIYFRRDIFLLIPHTHTLSTSIGIGVGGRSYE